MVERLRTSFSDRRLVVLGALIGLSGLVAGLLAFRVAYSHSFRDISLLWNLFLAWIPFGLALLIYDRHRRGARLASLGALGLLWVVFFPNAPYIVTDFRYLDIADHTANAFWYEGLLIGTAASTGLLLGFMSLYLIQAIVRRAAGARYAWLFVFVALGLSSVGVYLGRVLRWNSWDVFVRPGSLLGELAGALVDPLGHPRPIAITILFTSFLLASYAIFYSLARTTSLLGE
jgi:uncharacterized membrane protein